MNEKIEIGPERRPTELGDVICTLCQKTMSAHYIKTHICIKQAQVYAQDALNDKIDREQVPLALGDARCERCAQIMPAHHLPTHVASFCTAKDPKSLPDDGINHPQHYGGDTMYEVIKVLRAWGLTDNACLFNVIKYLSRGGKKQGEALIKDLKKAQWYLNEEVRHLEEEEIRKHQGHSAHAQTMKAENRISRNLRAAVDSAAQGSVAAAMAGGQINTAESGLSLDASPRQIERKARYWERQLARLLNGQHPDAPRPNEDY